MGTPAIPDGPEADIQEQRANVEPDADDAALDPRRVSTDPEVPEADAIEQALTVPPDDDGGREDSQ